MADVQFKIVDDAESSVVDRMIDDIIALYRAAGWWRDGRSRRESLSDMIRGSFLFMVAESPDGSIIGMGRVISDGVSDGYIQDVTVLPSCRGKGIGRDIVGRLAGLSKDRGLEWVGLVAEPGTQPFYESLGFKPLAGYQPMLFDPAR